MATPHRSEVDAQGQRGIDEAERGLVSHGVQAHLLAALTVTLH